LLGESAWFGDDDDASPQQAVAKPYERGSEEWQVLRAEAEDDERCDVTSPIKASIQQTRVRLRQVRDTVLRKIKPLVFFRHSFSKYDPARGRRVRKPRKIRTDFFGVPAVFDISAVTRGF
jgi:hypothetical protein